MKRPARIVSRTVIPAGMATSRRAAPESEWVRMADREWQPEALEVLCRANRRRLLAPTGSGKSLVQRAVMWHDVLQGSKALITVPQVVIGKSFRAKKIELPNGDRFEWAPGVELFDCDDSTIETLSRFVLDPPGPTYSSRIAICTHDTLRGTHKELMRKGKSWGAKGRVSLAIDEAQFLKMDTALVGGKEKDDFNRLGEVATYWIEQDPGNLMLATATWLRGDQTTILRRELLETFAKYQLTADRYLATFPKGFEVVFSYAMGSPEDVLKHLFTEPCRKVIDFMRHTSTIDDSTNKYNLVRSRFEALGKYTTGDVYNVHERPDGSSLVSLDLVTDKPESARKFRQRVFLDSLESHKNQPDYVAAMNIGKMGLDWEECNTAIIDTERTSMGDRMQMGGRTLRIFPGKMRAEILTILEPPRRDRPDFLAKVRGSLKTLLASLVIEWQFRVLRLPKDVEELVKDPEKMESLLGDVVDDVIRSPKSKPEEDILRGRLEKALPGDENEAKRKVLEDFLKRELQSKRNQDLHTADEVPDEILAGFRSSMFGFLRYHSFALGAGDLTNLRTTLEASKAIPYEDLKREVARLGIKSQAEYTRRYKEIDGAPEHPSTAYTSFSYHQLFGAKGPQRIRK